jgi:prevent-host-death family protein
MLLKLFVKMCGAGHRFFPFDTVRSTGPDWLGWDKTPIGRLAFQGTNSSIHKFILTTSYDHSIFIWSFEGAMPVKSKKTIRVIAISKFKAKCLSLLDEVNKTKAPLRVTRRGKAIADVIPASTEGNERSWIGSMSGSVDILGDILSPVIDLEDIEVLKK